MGKERALTLLLEGVYLAINLEKTSQWFFGGKGVVGDGRTVGLGIGKGAILQTEVPEDLARVQRLMVLVDERVGGDLIVDRSSVQNPCP